MVVCSSCNRGNSSMGLHVQLQQGQVRVAVVRLALALGHDIVLESARRLGVVSVQAIEDGLDVLWPFRRKVECGAHGGVSCPKVLVGATRKSSLCVVRQAGQATSAAPRPEWPQLLSIPLSSTKDVEFGNFKCLGDIYVCWRLPLIYVHKHVDFIN